MICTPKWNSVSTPGSLSKISESVTTDPEHGTKDQRYIFQKIKKEQLNEVCRLEYWDEGINSPLLDNARVHVKLGLEYSEA